VKKDVGEVSEGVRVDKRSGGIIPCDFREKGIPEKFRTRRSLEQKKFKRKIIDDLNFCEESRSPVDRRIWEKE
jgi:hypothetical protein